MKNLLGLVCIALILGTLGCAGSGKKSSEKLGGEPVYYALAVVNPTNGNKTSGRVWFSEAFGKVKIEVELSGLDKNSKHGFHIHEFGDCTAPDGTSAGGHYNPEGHEHAGLEVTKRHAGDLGNLVTDKKGNVKYSFEVSNLSINSGLNPVIGRGVIVHENIDDHVTQPTGGAGPRVACGVIGAATRAN